MDPTLLVSAEIDANGAHVKLLTESREVICRLQRELESERSLRAASDKRVRTLVRECDEAHEECAAFTRRLQRCDKKLKIAQEREASASKVELQAEIDRLKSSQNDSILSREIAEKSLRCDALSKKCDELAKKREELEDAVAAKQSLLSEKTAESKLLRAKLAAAEEDLTRVQKTLDASERGRVERERSLSEKHCVETVSLKAAISDLRVKCEREADARTSLESKIQSLKQESRELHDDRLAREAEFRSHIETMTSAWARAQQVYADQSEALVATTESRLSALSERALELGRLVSELSQTRDAQESDIVAKRHELETLSAVVRKQAKEKNASSTQAFNLKTAVEQCKVQLLDMSRAHAGEKLRLQKMVKALRDKLVEKSRECEAHLKSAAELDGKLSVLRNEKEMSDSQLAKERQRSECMESDSRMVCQLKAQLNAAQRENLAHKRLEKEIFRSRSKDVKSLTEQVERLKSARDAEAANNKRTIDELRARLSRSQSELQALHRDHNTIESIQAHTAANLARSVDQLQRIQRRSLHSSPTTANASLCSMPKSAAKHRSPRAPHAHSMSISWSVRDDEPPEMSATEGEESGLWTPVTDVESSDSYSDMDM